MSIVSPHPNFDAQLHSETGITMELINLIAYQNAELSICDDLESFRLSHASHDATFYRVRTVGEHISESVHREMLSPYIPNVYITERINAQVFVMNVVLKLLQSLAENDVDARAGDSYFQKLKAKIFELIGNILSIIRGTSLTLPDDLWPRVQGILLVPEAPTV